MSTGMDQAKIIAEEQLLSVTEELLKEIISVREHNKKVTLEGFRARVNGVAKLRQMLEDQVKNEVEALTQEHKRLTENTGVSDQVKELQQQEQQLLQEHASLQQNCSQLSEQCERLQEKHNQLTETSTHLQKEKDRLENETAVIVPKRREEINLYTYMSKIRWDFDGPKEEINGYVSNKKNVQPFCFDKRKCSQFFIANSLWDSMIEEV